MATPKVNPSQFLEDARPFAKQNKFILGTFERGITFYRQQIRALNLIYSLVEAKDATGAPKISPRSRVVIVGGGAFGTTAAAAAAYAGLRDADCGDAIEFMKRQRDIRDSGQQIFPAGWWGRYTAPADAANDDRPPVPVEFVPPALMTYGTTFVSTLGNILEFLIDKKSPNGTDKREFRVTLHRLTRFDGREVFQQITPYVGRVESKAGFGRFFPVEGGIVGLACRTGSLVVARKTNAETFDKIWDLTKLVRSGAKPVKRYVDSIFACPFFAPEEDGEPDHVSLVLFVDSAEADFFDGEVMGTIHAACRGFVQLLETLHVSGALKPVPTFYPGFQVQPNADSDPLVCELKSLGVKFEHTSDRAWKGGLTFKTLKSLDLELARSMKFA